MAPSAAPHTQKRHFGIYHPAARIAALLLLPPGLLLVGIVIWSAIQYEGVCPGVMDIGPYPCSMWAYIGRNTISPFALAGLSIICIGWQIFSVAGLLVYKIIQRIWGEFKNK